MSNDNFSQSYHIFNNQTIQNQSSKNLHLQQLSKGFNKFKKGKFMLFSKTKGANNMFIRPIL